MSVQCVKLVYGMVDIENRLNKVIDEMNNRGWELIDICRYEKGDVWCLTFSTNGGE